MPKKRQVPPVDRPQPWAPVKVREVTVLVAVLDVLGEPDATVLQLWDPRGRLLGQLVDLNLSRESVDAWGEVLAQ